MQEMNPGRTSWNSPETTFSCCNDGQPREGRQGHQQGGKPKITLEAVIYWLASALGLESLKGGKGVENRKHRHVPQGRAALPLVFTLILSLCKIHECAHSDCESTSTRFIERHSSACPWQEYKCFLCEEASFLPGVWNQELIFPFLATLNGFWNSRWLSSL